MNLTSDEAMIWGPAGSVNYGQRYRSGVRKPNSSLSQGSETVFILRFFMFVVSNGDLKMLTLRGNLVECSNSFESSYHSL